MQGHILNWTTQDARIWIAFFYDKRCGKEKTKCLQIEGSILPQLFVVRHIDEYDVIFCKQSILKAIIFLAFSLSHQGIEVFKYSHKGHKGLTGSIFAQYALH